MRMTPRKTRAEIGSGHPSWSKVWRPHPLGGDFMSAGLKETREKQTVEETYWKIGDIEDGLEAEPDECKFFQDETVCSIANTIAIFIVMVKEATKALKQQNTSEGSRTIRDQVYRQLKHITLHMESFKRSVKEIDPPLERECPAPTFQLENSSETSLNQLAKDIEEIKAALNLSNIEQEIKEIKTAIHEPPKSWENLVSNATPDKPTVLAIANALAQRREIQEKRKKEHEPYKVTLMTTNSKTKEVLAAMHAHKITEQC